MKEGFQEGPTERKRGYLDNEFSVTEMKFGIIY